VCSRNLEYEEAKSRYWAVKIQPEWVVTPGKQTNIVLIWLGIIFCDAETNNEVTDTPRITP
jgi:hypothetical protein